MFLGMCWSSDLIQYVSLKLTNHQFDEFWEHFQSPNYNHLVYHLSIWWYHLIPLNIVYTVVELLTCLKTTIHSWCICLDVFEMHCWKALFWNLWKSTKSSFLMRKKIEVQINYLKTNIWCWIFFSELETP